MRQLRDFRPSTLVPAADISGPDSRTRDQGADNPFADDTEAFTIVRPLISIN